MCFPPDVECFIKICYNNTNMNKVSQKIGIGAGVVVLSSVALSIMYALWKWLTTQFDPLFTIVATLAAVMVAIVYLGNAKVNTLEEKMDQRMNVFEDSLSMLVEGMKEGGLAKEGTPLALAVKRMRLNTGKDGATNSPMRFTEQGKRNLKMSGMEDFVQENKEQLFRMLDETGLTEQYDLEAKSFEFTETVLKLPENGEYMKQARRYDYQKGYIGITGPLALAGLYLRDVYFAHKNIPVDINLEKATATHKA